MAEKILFSRDEKPPFLMNILLGLQHAILIVPGSVFGSLVVANIICMPENQKPMLVFVTMLITGAASFIQIHKVGKIGSGYVLFLGSSTAFMGAAIPAGLMGGYALIATMALLSAPLEILLSYFLWYIRKIVTSRLGGIVIILIAISIIPSMLELWTGAKGTATYCSSGNLFTGFITLIVTLFFAIFGSKYVRLWSPIIGIIAGVIAATFFGIIDFSALEHSPLIGLPRGKWILPDFHLGLKHIPVFIAFLFATFASTVESMGDSIIVQDASDRDFKKVDYGAVQGCLYADGVGSMLSGFCGTLPNTTYSGNIAVVELTGVASRSVGYVASLVMIGLAFFPKFVYGLILIPGPVIGASTLFLMGLLFASGMKLIAQDGINYESSIILGISITVGIISTFKLFFPPLISDSIKPFLENGVATGGIVALILTAIMKLRPTKHRSIRLNNDINELATLRTFINNLDPGFNLDADRSLRLQLTCEEAFVFLQDDESDSMISFDFRLADDHVLVEVTKHADIIDVDQIDERQIRESKPERLGLLLLNKLAKNIQHLRIGSNNSIMFEI